MAVELDRAVIDLEIRADGSVTFHISGLPGQECEQLEAVLLEVLRGEVTERHHTAEFYQQVQPSLRRRLAALLGRG